MTKYALTYSFPKFEPVCCCTFRLISYYCTAEFFGKDRSISLCRELTKLHEEVIRTTLGEAIARYTLNPPKGEFVLVVAGAPEIEKETASPADAAARVNELMASGMSRKDAVKQTAKELDLPRNVVYDAALEQSN